MIIDIREISESNLPQLLDLCVDTLPYDNFSLDQLGGRVFGELQREPRYQLVAFDGDQLTGVMLGSVRKSATNTHAGIRLFCTAPSHQNQGIASALLAELESRILADGITNLSAGNVAPDYFWPGVDTRYTRGVCFLESRGFQREGEGINMLVNLKGREWGDDQLEQQLADQGITIERLAHERREQFSRWMRSEWGEMWNHESLEGLKNDPSTTWVAYRESNPIAFASYDITAFASSFGPTGTEQSQRGLGVGRVLFYRCMEDIRARGDSTSEICWVGPIAFYAKVADAWINRVFWMYRKELRKDE